MQYIISLRELKLRKENADFPKFRTKLLKFSEVKAENSKLRHITEENTRRETENNELKPRLQHVNSSKNDSSNFNFVAERHEDVCSSKWDRETDDFSPKEPANISDSNHSLVFQIEDREIDAFLIKTHKESISK
ncbi:hypothetical protein GLOIN_2v1736632 [Rhizophagus clarus]|uniref:Uncharacterized protein n=1 Tax=Rhizophagus clarus TaxID=94130 RepID=A0A8H3LWV6_9GLOM|nr:hypothetical protein GLOIN_2v1736632 [Rhizophagus clarus]